MTFTRRLAVSCFMSISVVVALASPACAQDTTTSSTLPILATVPVPVVDNTQIVVVKQTPPAKSPGDNVVVAPSVVGSVTKTEATNTPAAVTAPVITLPATSSTQNRQTPVVTPPSIGESTATIVSPVPVTPKQTDTTSGTDSSVSSPGTTVETPADTVVSPAVPQQALPDPVGPGPVWSYALYGAAGALAGWVLHRTRIRRHTS